jgi:RNA polymerase sigma-70 factor (ECF subfamily)
VATGVGLLADMAAGPEARVPAVEELAQLAKILALLPPVPREIVVLRVVVGLTAEETARLVGGTPGSVRVAQHRALAGLRCRLRRDVLLTA